MCRRLNFTGWIVRMYFFSMQLTLMTSLPFRTLKLIFFLPFLYLFVIMKKGFFFLSYFFLISGSSRTVEAWPSHAVRTQILGHVPQRPCVTHKRNIRDGNRKQQRIENASSFCFVHVSHFPNIKRQQENKTSLFFFLLICSAVAQRSSRAPPSGEKLFFSFFLIFPSCWFCLGEGTAVLIQLIYLKKIKLKRSTVTTHLILQTETVGQARNRRRWRRWTSSV